MPRTYQLTGYPRNNYRISSGRTKYVRGRKQKGIARRFAAPKISTSYGLPRIVSSRHRCKLTYRDKFILSGASGTITHTFITVNSLYDPQTSVGGRQPTGFDQLAALYHKYRVFGFKYKVTYQPIDAAGGSRQEIIAVPNHDATHVYVNLDDVKGEPYAKSMITGGINSVSRQTLTGYINISQLAGKNIRYDDSHAALVTANPSVPVYLAVLSQCTDGTSTQTGNIYIEVDYFCEFFKRKAILEDA